MSSYALYLVFLTELNELAIKFGEQITIYKVAAIVIFIDNYSNQRTKLNELALPNLILIFIDNYSNQRIDW